MHIISKNLFTLSLLVLVAFSTSGCIKNKDVRGYTLDPEKLEQIKPFASKKNDVLAALGSPSSTSSFGDETWYYINNKLEYVAFFDPKVKEQTVVAIAFDGSGKVTNVRQYNADDREHLNYASDKTETPGNEMGVLEQLLGNVGKFNSDPSNPASSLPRSQRRPKGY
ncbi:MAG: outer membrane protein assembly factor BamE [Rickettsiales bacterium]|jgi:outer membrane protein assembly factor BamE (lipoprotein component of BamABCDE complex)|nr:outer membrane protein assembly factor BamE [Rickettsiales bacterium]